MATIPNLTVNTSDIEKAKSIDELKRAMKRFVFDVDRILQKIRVENQAYAWRTKTWRGYEDSNGNLLIEKWNGSTWDEFRTWVLS